MIAEAALVLALSSRSLAAQDPAINAAARSLASQLVRKAGSRKLVVAVEDFTVGGSWFGGGKARALRDGVEKALKASPRFRVIKYSAVRAAGNRGYVIRGRIAGGLAEAWLDKPGAGKASDPRDAALGIAASVELKSVRVRRTRGIDVEEASAESAPEAAPATAAPVEEPAAAAAVIADRMEGESDLKVELWTDRGEAATYQAGEEIVVHVRANRDCTLRLVYVDAEGRLNTIFPNDWSSPGAGRIKAGAIYTIPSATDDFKFTVTPPFGNEAIKALATTGSLAEALPNQECSGAEGACKMIRRTRGIMLEAAPADATPTAPAYAETAATVTTVNP